jgi:uncharacterized protein (TIGR02118 family)
MSAERYAPPPRRESMLKLVHLLRRKPGLSLSEFQEHWLERHSQFALSLPAVRRYVQYHALADDPIREALAQAADGPLVDSYDGVAISWFDDVKSLTQAMNSEAVAAALEDERHFIDHSRSVAVLVDEHVVVEPIGAGPIVLVECLRRQPAIDRHTFSERWLHHGHLGREAHARGLLAGYIQNHALAPDDARVAGLHLGSSGEDWDGVVIAYFDSTAVAKELFGDPLASETAYEDERAFIDHSQALYLMARRHPIKDLVR